MLTFLKAKIWSGAGWLLTLCAILVVVTIVYFVLHIKIVGYDHKTLDNNQLTSIDNVLANYPDAPANAPATTPANVPATTPATRSATTPATTDVNSQRQKRDDRVITFLKNEYNGTLDSCWITRTKPVLAGLDNKSLKQYLGSREIIVNDFFWFVGSGSYAEVLFWALFGVLVSLIYYVSVANSKTIQGTTDPDIGPFDFSEIPEQVAKMFYAPVCALVLVLGYNLLNSDNKMTDISMGKGLLLFSFICGFFSGRVMKFLDRLKELVLPIGSSTSSASSSASAAAADITVNLQLSQAESQSPEGPDIVEGGFNKATVTLTPDSSGDAITLQAPADDQGAAFTSKQVALGKYTLKAVMAHTDSANATINLAASQDIEITATETTFTLSLDKTTDNG